jgi:two-component sensor histidine kinase
MYKYLTFIAIIFISPTLYAQNWYQADAFGGLLNEKKQDIGRRNLFSKRAKTVQGEEDTSIEVCKMNKHLNMNFFKRKDKDIDFKYYNLSLDNAKAFHNADTIYIGALNIAGASCMGDGKQYELLKILQSITNEYQLSQNTCDIYCRITGAFLIACMKLYNYKTAVFQLSRFHNIQNSFFLLTKKRQIRQLQPQLDKKEKESQINKLNQDEKLERGNMQRADLTGITTVADIILILIIVVLLYRQNWLRKKTKEEIASGNDIIRELVSEKEWLLKEVHHRVKNNLHIVICLLESQAAYLENDALRAIEVSQHRIYTMSLIHQALYQSDGIKTIEMALFIPELVQYLKDCFEVSGIIHFAFNIDKIHLNAAQAIPLSLIINEALTNSIKYAFPDNAKGDIWISLKNNRGQIILEVADNGIGMHQDPKIGFTNSLGLELMKGLSKELGGQFSFANNKGVTIAVSFKYDNLNENESFGDRSSNLF